MKIFIQRTNLNERRSGRDFAKQRVIWNLKEEHKLDFVFVFLFQKFFLFVKEVVIARQLNKKKGATPMKGMFQRPIFVGRFYKKRPRNLGSCHLCIVGRIAATLALQGALRDRPRSEKSPICQGSLAKFEPCICRACYGLADISTRIIIGSLSGKSHICVGLFRKRDMKIWGAYNSLPPHSSLE